MTFGTQIFLLIVYFPIFFEDSDKGESRLSSYVLYFSGNIKDLYNIKLKAGHAAAFATDCDLPLSHEMVRSIGMQVNSY